MASILQMLRSAGRDKKGSVVAQFALGLPVALSAIFGTVELGRLGFTQAALSYAASEATRYAIVRDGVTTEEIEAYAASKLTGVFNREVAVITAQAPIDPVTGTSLISVEVSYQYQFVLPFMPTEGIAMAGVSSGFLAFPPSQP